MSKFSRFAVISAIWLVAGTACSEDESPSQRTGDGAAGLNVEQVTPEALQAAVSDERVKRLYESRGWQPI